MAAEAAVAATSGAAVGAFAFGYNRENFMWDQENRWERFTSAREYANQQAEQFRGDLRALAALTSKKSTIWCIMSSLTMALCVALYCAGRLGLHGPSPPAWIMGLWLTNNAAAFAFMALCMFLSMHAGFRAQASCTQLLTRKTRVPVPTLSQLDNARRFASEFEQQDAGDIFRIPMVSANGAPRTDDAIYTSDGPGAQARTQRSGSAPPSRRGACSSWIKEEFKTDRAAKLDPQDPTRELPPLDPDTAPEHFRLFTQVQKEYYEHDIYARICIFYGFVHYVQSLCYYGLGHINIELRAFWVAYGTVVVIATLQFLLLKFDIIPANHKKEWLPYCQYLGPVACITAAAAMSIDFQVQFNPHAIAVCWVLIFVTYILQFFYSLRLFEIVLPDELFVAPGERLGGTWLPEGWRSVPSAFYHVWYFVAPPTKLQPGQHDLVREVKDGGEGAYSEVAKDDVAADASAPRYRSPEPIQGQLFANSEHIRPWKLVARIVFVMPCAWAFLIAGTAVDVVLGEQALVTAPHWSRPPLTRLSKEPHELGTPLGGPRPSGDLPFTPEQMAWHEEKRHAGEYNLGRRLQGSNLPPQVAFPDALKNLVEAISTADKASAAKSDVERISWPGFFEPKLLVCGEEDQVVAALTARGFGAAAHVGQSGEMAAESFKLSGLTHLPALLSASLGLEGGDGLLTISRGGHLTGCPGSRPKAGGVWRCSVALPRLPIADGTRLEAAAAAWLPERTSTGSANRRLHAAMVLDSAPDTVGLFVHEAGSWLPLGEAAVPGGKSRLAKTSLSFVGASDLMVATEDRIIRRNLVNGQVVSSMMNTHPTHGNKAWQASCSFSNEGKVSHLQLQKTPTSRAWRPELISVKLS